MVKEEKNNLLTAPNLLSFLRILLVPLFLVMIFRQKIFIALLVFIVAGVTDLLDGLFARIWHQKTRIGALLDPAADKLLATPAFIVLTLPALSSPNTIPLWLTAVVIGRDLFIGVGTFILYILTSQKSFSPSLLGKTTTFCQVGIILLVLFFNAIETSPSFLRLVFHLTLIATILSGIHYTYVGVRILSTARQS